MTIDTIREYLKLEAPEQVDLGDIDLTTEAGIIEGVSRSLRWATEQGAVKYVWARYFNDLINPKHQAGKLPTEISWRLRPSVSVWSRPSLRSAGSHDVTTVPVTVTAWWGTHSADAAATLHLEKLLVSSPYEPTRHVYTWLRAGAGVLGELLAYAAQHMIKEEDCRHIHATAAEIMNAVSEGTLDGWCICDARDDSCQACELAWSDEREWREQDD